MKENKKRDWEEWTKLADETKHYYIAEEKTNYSANYHAYITTHDGVFQSIKIIACTSPLSHREIEVTSQDLDFILELLVKEGLWKVT